MTHDLQPTHAQDEEDRRMGYVLDHIDRRFEAHRVYVDQRVGEILLECLEQHTKRFETSDYGKPVWARGADHMTEHWWGKLSKKGMGLLVGAVVMAGLIWLGSLGIIFKKP